MSAGSLFVGVATAIVGGLIALSVATGRARHRCEPPPFVAWQAVSDAAGGCSGCGFAVMMTVFVFGDVVAHI